ncbi:phospholipid methyltransferase-domain-containing protein [Melampsora americana]|nr:phospholipid methyltransferase-domain-containing protein [Melampsora americana]
MMNELIDFHQTDLWISLISIIFNPLFWNIVARKEHSTRFLTKLFRSPYRACYFLGTLIFSIGILRDHLYQKALLTQPTHDFLNRPILARILFSIGSSLVISSMWKLGITGTYLGDYFGILMDQIVIGFPFNITQSPMYDGSTLCFLATAFHFKSPAGLFLTGLIYLVYQIALRFEDPFTASIYAARDSKKKVN